MHLLLLTSYLFPIISERVLYNTRGLCHGTAAIIDHNGKAERDRPGREGL